MKALLLALTLLTASTSYAFEDFKPFDSFDVQPQPIQPTQTIVTFEPQPLVQQLAQPYQSTYPQPTSYRCRTIDLGFGNSRVSCEGE